jgi:hypothetical protein
MPRFRAVLEVAAICIGNCKLHRTRKERVGDQLRPIPVANRDNSFNGRASRERQHAY